MYRDWTPAITNKLSSEGFLKFPDTTPRTTKNRYEGTSLLSPFNFEHGGNEDHANEYRFNPHFSQNAEALRNR
jgi:hypothetical protein